MYNPDYNSLVQGPSWSYSYGFTTICAISVYHH